jgi:hypothetical protein
VKHGDTRNFHVGCDVLSAESERSLISRRLTSQTIQPDRQFAEPWDTLGEPKCQAHPMRLIGHYVAESAFCSAPFAYDKQNARMSRASSWAAYPRPNFSVLGVWSFLCLTRSSDPGSRRKNGGLILVQCFRITRRRSTRLLPIY